MGRDMDLHGCMYTFKFNFFPWEFPWDCDFARSFLLASIQNSNQGGEEFLSIIIIIDFASANESAFFVSLYKGSSCKTDKTDSDKSVGLTLRGSWIAKILIPHSLVLKCSIQNNYRLVGLLHDPVRVLFKERDSSYSKVLTELT